MQLGRCEITLACGCPRVEHVACDWCHCHPTLACWQSKGGRCSYGALPSDVGMRAAQGYDTQPWGTWGCYMFINWAELCMLPMQTLMHVSLPACLLCACLQAFSAESRKHTVQYADTVEEDLDLAIVPWQPKDAPIPAPAAPAPAAAAPAAAEPAAAAAAPAPAAGGAAPAVEGAEQEAPAAATTSDEAAGQGRAIKKIKITMKSSGPLPAGAAAEATKTDSLSPTEGSGRPRRQAAMVTPAAAAAGSSGGGAGTSSKAAGGKDSAGKDPADKAAAEKSIKSPGSAEKAQRMADAQVGARIKILWPKDKVMYSGEIIVSAAIVGSGTLLECLPLF